MFQSKRARRSAQLLRRCESHDTSHCVLKSGPGLPLSSRFSARLPRRATPVVRYDVIWKHAPPPSLPRIHGTWSRREHGASASARLEILRSGEADLMPLGQCLRRYVLSYARASDEL